MSNIPQWLEQACDDIDAGFFSGDTFRDEETLSFIENNLIRWYREIERIKSDNIIDNESNHGK